MAWGKVDFKERAGNELKALAAEIKLVNGELNSIGAELTRINALLPGIDDKRAEKISTELKQAMNSLKDRKSAGVGSELQAIK
jgi:hypothetical protein